MAIQTTTWHPDTCACIIEYQWDDSVPDAARVHTPSRIVSQCPFHAGLSVADHGAKLFDENPRKNKTLDAIMTQVPAVILDDITWSFDSNRVLNITCPKLTQGQKTAIQNIANNKFGVGKVVFL